MKIKNRWGFNWGKLILAGVPVTGLLLALRMSGWLQPLEWAAYDFFFQWRPLEAIEPRLVIVGLEEPEVEKYYPLTDRTLANLIEKIQRHQPAAIGLDFYRDVGVGEGSQQLLQVFQTTPNLFGIEKVIGEQKSLIAPPPLLKEKGQTASSDVVVDSDGVLRRGLLAPTADGESHLFSLGATLALLYLQRKGIAPETSADGKGIQLGEVVFYPFGENDGGYRHADAGGYQLLLNFRNPARSFQTVSFSEVLQDQIAPDLFRERLVLIGSTSASLKDEFYTPFSRSLSSPPKLTYGVEVQANLSSHLISAVLDRRPLVRVLPNFGEYLLIVFWGAVSAFAIWRLLPTKNYLGLSLKAFTVSLIVAGVAVGSSYLAFLKGWWFPVIPSLIEVGGMSLAVSGLILHEKNRDLKDLLHKLEMAHEQIILEKKQSALANLVAGVAHEVNNPLNFILNFAELSIEWGEKLKEEMEKHSANLPPESKKEVETILGLLEGNLAEILQHSQRAARITSALLRQAHFESYKPTLTDINQLVDSTFHLVGYSNQEKNQDFSLNLKTDYDPAIGERALVVEDLNQVLINLLDNACDAVFEKHEQGEEFEPTVAITTQLLKDESVKITVSDNGAGIASELADQIFEPFKTTKPPGKGTGLGLYITYDLVQKNRGKISWARQDELTKFTVIFPTKKSLED